MCNQDLVEVRRDIRFLELSYRWFSAAVQALGTAPGFSGKARSVPNHSSLGPVKIFKTELLEHIIECELMLLSLVPIPGLMSHHMYTPASTGISISWVQACLRRSSAL